MNALPIYYFSYPIVYNYIMNEEVLSNMKTKAMKCKIISLDLLGHYPLSNPSSLNPRQKSKVIQKMKVWFEKEDKEVDKEFNDIVSNNLLHAAQDISVLPCIVINPSEYSI